MCSKSLNFTSVLCRILLMFKTKFFPFSLFSCHFCKNNASFNKAKALKTSLYFAQVCSCPLKNGFNCSQSQGLEIVYTLSVFCEKIKSLHKLWIVKRCYSTVRSLCMNLFSLDFHSCEDLKCLFCLMFLDSL